MAVNNFDRIAAIYDPLVKLVFSDKLKRAQSHFLNQITPNVDVLILGGGSGEILLEIPKCNSICYVEKSKKMVEKARKRYTNRNIEYINEDFFNYEPSDQFDFVICPFFLDCFAESNLNAVLSKTKSLTKKNGLLIVTDFAQTKSNGWLLRLMHAFFRITVRLESRFLLDIHEKVVNVGFQEVEAIFLHRNQLFSRLYRNL